MSQDLLRVNSLFCDLTPLYYRRVMGEKFQHHYLRIRMSFPQSAPVYFLI